MLIVSDRTAAENGKIETTMTRSKGRPKRGEVKAQNERTLLDETGEAQRRQPGKEYHTATNQKNRRKEMREKESYQSPGPHT
jgi:hypothetical protein